MDEFEHGVGGFDYDGLKNPLPRSKMPGSGHQGTTLERRDVVFQGVDDPMDHLQGSSRQVVVGGLFTSAHHREA